MVISMQTTAPRISIHASLTGIRELYLLILGIGITEALVNIPTPECSWTFFSYIALMLGFLATVFRFALEAMILLEFIASKTHQWRPTYFVMILLTLASALIFFLMGHNLNHFAQFMVYTIVMLMLDMWLLYCSHRPWERGGLWHLIKKMLAILSGYKLFAQFHPQHLPGFENEPEKRLIYATHHQWLRGNAYLILLLAAFYMYWTTHALPGVCPTHAPHTWQEWDNWVQYWPQKLWVSQWFISLLLLGFAIWDIKANYAYYFGSESKA